MKTLQKTISLEQSGISLQQIYPGMHENLEDSLFFDIETTGFRPEYCHIYLIGCAEFHGQEATITLYFAEMQHEEKAILEAFAHALSAKKQCFTFNGNRFDIPFIEKRCQKYGLPLKPSTMPCFDLYRFIKQFDILLKLPHYKQKNLEEYLGILREDEYNGGELIQVYKDYEKHPTDEAFHLLQLHNFEDVQGMLQLLPLLNLGYVFDKSNYHLDTYDVSEKEISITGTLSHPVPKKLLISNPSLYLSLTDSTFRGVIYPYVGSLKYFYPNYRDYVYLTQEQMVIPKILADSVPKDQKTRATKENCFQAKTGSFLPLPASGLLDPYAPHLFQEDAKSKQHYALLEEFPLDADIIIRLLLSHIKA